jgi:RNA polymerase sigma-70 factor, ECF subfamily
MAPEPINEPELQRLVALARDGDSAAFERVYDQFFLPVYRYTAFRAPSEMVEDLVAEVFVKVWEKLHQYRFQKGVPFGAWVFRIARHAVIDAYRKDRSYEEVGEELEDPDRWNRADARTHAKDTLRVVRAALQELPKRYREILLLSYVAELSTSEVARVLRLTEGAVRILKFRALRKLEAQLPPEMRKKA